MCMNILKNDVQNFRAISSIVFFWQNFKDVRGDPVYRDLFSHLKFRLGLKGYNSTNIVDKWMKFAGHLVCGILIKVG